MAGATEVAEADTNYAVIVTEKSGRYCLRINELCLFVWGETVDAAYQELIRRKQRLIDDAREADLLDQLPSARASHGWKRATEAAVEARPRQPWVSRGSIVMGALLIAVVVGLPVGLGIAIQQVTADIRHAVPRGRDFWTMVERDIVSAADSKNEMDPERKARLLASLQVLVQRAKPFVDELAPLTAPAPPGPLPAIVLVKP
jgi:hypothetical protein